MTGCRRSFQPAMPVPLRAALRTALLTALRTALRYPLRSPLVAVLVAVLTSHCLACGTVSPTGDAATDSAVDSGADTGHDTGADPGPDTGHDTGDDTIDDFNDDPDATDTPTDDSPDGADATEDATGDTDDDAPTDVSPDPDASDSPTETDGGPVCRALEVGFEAGSVDAWAQCFMGVGTAAAFTLVFTNPSTDCDITGIGVASGSLRLDSDDSVIFTFSGLTPTTSFTGTIASGDTVAVDYGASDPVDGEPYDGLDVYVRANVTWTGGSESAESAPVSLTCVY